VKPYPSYSLSRDPEPRPHMGGTDGASTTQTSEQNWSVTAAKEVSFQIRLTSGVLDPGNQQLIEAGAAVGQDLQPRRLLVVDSRVADIYGEQIRAYFLAHGAKFRLLALPCTEAGKRIEAVQQIIDELDDFGIDRNRDPLIAIGGGVLMDIAGVAACLYRRGSPYVRVPTTLIGLVDAGIGSKTGVNHGPHKNRLGAYYPARVTLADRSFLATLDDRHIVNGLAEILKVALVRDVVLFELLETYGTDLIKTRFQDGGDDVGAAASQVLHRAIQGMLQELAPNLWEQDLERLMDYGHSFSPTLEMAALPQLLHGEAVSIDMALSTVLSLQRGLLTEGEVARIFAVSKKLALPVRHELIEPGLLSAALAETTRHRGGEQRLPLSTGIGKATFVNDVTIAELTSAGILLAGRWSHD
jgi:2-epi-5-epi-valiolone synthase